MATLGLVLPTLERPATLKLKGISPKHVINMRDDTVDAGLEIYDNERNQI